MIESRESVKMERKLSVGPTHTLEVILKHHVNLVSLWWFWFNPRNVTYCLSVESLDLFHPLVWRLPLTFTEESWNHIIQHVVPLLSNMLFPSTDTKNLAWGHRVAWSRAAVYNPICANKTALFSSPRGAHARHLTHSTTPLFGRSFHLTLTWVYIVLRGISQTHLKR